MRFTFNGPYIEYRGYVFAYGKPTEVVDKATQGLLLARKDFARVPDDAPEPVVQMPKRPVLSVGRRK